MIKNYSNSLVALVCAAGLALSSCTKQADVQPQLAPVSASATTVAAAATTTQVSALAGSGLMLGINGHPFGDAPYLATPATKQVELLKGMGMNWYRINVQTTSDGTISASSSTLFSSLQQAAASGAVNLLPMLYPRTLNLADSEAVAYEKENCWEATLLPNTASILLTMTWVMTWSLLYCYPILPDAR
jgi:hypothetical protein